MDIPLVARFVRRRRNPRLPPSPPKCGGNGGDRAWPAVSAVSQTDRSRHSPTDFPAAPAWTRTPQERFPQAAAGKAA
jgi:hypothetical protein